MSEMIFVKGVKGRTVYVPNTKHVIPEDRMISVVPTITIIRAIQAGDLIELVEAPEEPKTKSSPKTKDPE